MLAKVKIVWLKGTCLFTIVFLLLFAVSCAQCEMSHGQDIKTMKSFKEPVDTQVDTSTLTGKVMCGYQGWFTCDGDGANRGWYHWAESTRQGFGKFKPGHCSIDMWPDMSEADEDEKFLTEFQHLDGSPAYVFSSIHPKTVDRHFKWMKDYGIDGAFVQRFANETRSPEGLNHCNVVLNNCRKGANHHGRAYAVMYDLSGLAKGGTKQVIADWKKLVDQMRITKDPEDKAYLHHKGRPVVSVWGIGFDDRRPYTLAECKDLIDFLKNDPDYGQLTVMVGVPTYWRTFGKDTLDDPMLHEIISMADIVSPWTITRYVTLDRLPWFKKNVFDPDLNWCREKGIDYLPVLWPGFSWGNLRKDRLRINRVPRLEGRFLWQQYYWVCQSGATMIYQAMFDEVDEATAIFKCTDSPPVGASKFVDMEGMPSDHYLWLVGQGGKMLRGEIPLTKEIPAR